LSVIALGSNFGQIKSLEEAKAAAIANEEKCRSNIYADLI